MAVLIVEGDQELAGLWKRHLEREGAAVRVTASAEDACTVLTESPIDVLVVDLDLPKVGALTVADFASYRRPDARVIFVTAKTFFSDGSIFRLSPNAAGFLAAGARPEDLAALVAHHTPKETRDRNVTRVNEVL